MLSWHKQKGEYADLNTQHREVNKEQVKLTRVGQKITVEGNKQKHKV